MLSTLFLGLVLGMRHALEADHVAAVASLAARSAAPREALRVAAFWGVGHAAVLTLVGSLVVALGATLPPSLTPVLEIIAGTMLALLGLDLLRRLPGVRTGAHSHPPVRAVASRALLGRALVVGGVHGMEGLAALVVLGLPALGSTARAVGYLALFGLGSVVGIVACTLSLTIPLRLSTRLLSWGARGLDLAALGLLSIAIGGAIVARAALG